MSVSRTQLYRDKVNGKWLGICEGLGEYTGVDPLWIRLGFLVLTFATFPLMLFVYIGLAMVVSQKPMGLYETKEDAKFWQGVRANPRRSTQEVRSKLRDIDRRMADIETFYTSRNTQLADEIERLR
ncbi:MAG: envelope stress response membrane protein PspC [Sphingomonas sp.]|uniref:envelope stress response membrane protein PspC n=1 Tax=Sphingomonas sp. TaxID=28214 RepID=UPI00262B697D|nr:envelope stress response membrane protein PspC [Sphingomonas sp.]MDK2769220.1 envelope stress response membrane protein PspC [Sphingomonas sp.]